MGYDEVIKLDLPTCWMLSRALNRFRKREKLAFDSEMRKHKARGMNGRFKYNR